MDTLDFERDYCPFDIFDIQFYFRNRFLMLQIIEYFLIFRFEYRLGLADYFGDSHFPWGDNEYFGHGIAFLEKDLAYWGTLVLANVNQVLLLAHCKASKTAYTAEHVKLSHEFPMLVIF